MTTLSPSTTASPSKQGDQDSFWAGIALTLSVLGAIVGVVSLVVAVLLPRSALVPALWAASALVWCTACSARTWEAMLLRSRLGEMPRDDAEG